MRKAVALATLAILVCAPTTAVAAVKTPTDPVVLRGTSNGVELDYAEFIVHVWPRDDIERHLVDGDVVPTLELPGGVVSVSGSEFVVQLSPDNIPPNYVNDDGRVHFDITVREPGKQLIGSTSATLSFVDGLHRSEALWVDPLSPLGGGEGDVTVDQNSLKTLEKPVEVSIDMGPELMERRTMTAGAGSCKHGWVLETSSNRDVTIASTHVPSGTKSRAWAYHGSSRKHTMGIAVNDGNGWKSAGTKTFESGVEFDFISNRARTRNYRVENRYGRYRFQYSYPAYNVCAILERKWQPRFNTGGYAISNSTSSPSWTGDCTEVPGGTWKRKDSDGRSYSSSGGVKMKGLIGFDLLSKRSYSSSAYIAYKVVGKKLLCGSNHWPAKASRVRMKHS